MQNVQQKYICAEFFGFSTGKSQNISTRLPHIFTFTIYDLRSLANPCHNIQIPKKSRHVYTSYFAHVTLCMQQ